MSAFVHHPEHINVLVFAGLRPAAGVLAWITQTNPTHIATLTSDTADRTAQMLIEANVAGVNARYAEDEVLVQGYTRPQCTTWSAIDVLKALDSYEYQACEVDDWHETEAYAFCQALRRRIISSLPGYSNSPAWAITP